MRAVSPNSAGRCKCLAAALIALSIAAAACSAASLSAQEAPPRAEARAKGAEPSEEFGRLFDAVVDRTAQSFWDKDLLSTIGWTARAAQARERVLAAANIEEAARSINALLADLKTSHTALLTPDDVNYYILLDVFGGSRGFKELIAERFRGGGVRYAGIGMFSLRVEGRDFVDAVLEGSAAERTGLKVGDEIVNVDGAPYHPIRSFRGKVGEEVALTIRRAANAPPETLTVEVASIAPLRAFREATAASVRVIAREGRRIGYVHVWASVGEKSVQALTDALLELGIGTRERDSRSEKGTPRPAQLDGLIVDMRGKIGGTGQNAGRYLEALDPRGPQVRSRNKGASTRASVRGRTAVLIDHHTRSTAELFVHAYKRERQGPLIGTRTAGAVSAAAGFAMPGGNLLYLAVTGLEVDGEILEGPGVAPNIEVARPVPYSRGADPVLDAAVTHMVQNAKPRETVAPAGKDAGG
jgi:carboxyl-terminal processing protease